MTLEVCCPSIHYEIRLSLSQRCGQHRGLAPSWCRNLVLEYLGQLGVGIIMRLRRSCKNRPLSRRAEGTVHVWGQWSAKLNMFALQGAGFLTNCAKMAQRVDRKVSFEDDHRHLARNLPETVIRSNAFLMPRSAWLGCHMSRANC